MTDSRHKTKRLLKLLSEIGRGGEKSGWPGGLNLDEWKERDRGARCVPRGWSRARDGSGRIILGSPIFIAKYHDGKGIVVKKSTGCRHEDAARRVLADLEREAELVRSGVKTAAESAAGRHQATPLTTHLEAHLTYLEPDGACPEHRAERRRQLNRIARDCGFNQLADLDRSTLESWLAKQTRAGVLARTRNADLAGALAYRRKWFVRQEKRTADKCCQRFGGNGRYWT
jgi:hypothetical protein